MSNQDLLERYKKVMVPNYAPLPAVPIKAKGLKLWDADGKEYLDFTGGIAVTALGHIHDEVLTALKEQAEKLWHVSNYFANEPVIELAEALTSLTFAERCFFANSGSEVNEAALKLARRYAHNKVGEKKNKIIAFHKAFHGRSLFTVTAGGTDAYKQGFGPLPPQLHHSEHNDLEALAKIMDQDCCAVIMEPILGEGGVRNMDGQFAQGVRDLCDQHQALLIFDEVQTGMGRTGELFCYQGLGVTPDILTTAKALGNGFPIGAMMTSSEIANSFQPGTHGSTFGGNPLAAAVAKKTLEIISQPDILAGVRERGQELIQGLNQINEKHPIFTEIRGRGLLVGAQLKEGFTAGDILAKALKQGLLILQAGSDVLRFAPYLLITSAEIQEALGLLESAISEQINESR